MIKHWCKHILCGHFAYHLVDADGNKLWVVAGDWKFCPIYGKKRPKGTDL